MHHPTDRTTHTTWIFPVFLAGLFFKNGSETQNGGQFTQPSVEKKSCSLMGIYFKPITHQ